MKNNELISLYINFVSNSEKTQKAYKHALNKFCDFIIDIDNLTLEKYVEWRQHISNMAVTTQKLHITIVKGFLTWCFSNYEIGNSNEIIKINSMKNPRGNSKITQPLEMEEVEMMIRQGKNVRDKAVIALLASTGMRVSELTSLKLSDFSADGILVKGKGNKYRYVYPNNTAVELVNEYVNTMRKNKIKEKGLKTDLLFLSNNGTPLTTKSLDNTWKTLAKRCGITINVHNHTFRHTLGHTLINNGVGIDSVQAILGHSDISTTKIYAVKSNKEIQREIKTVNMF